MEEKAADPFFPPCLLFPANCLPCIVVKRPATIVTPSCWSVDRVRQYARRGRDSFTHLNGFREIISISSSMYEFT